MIDIHSNQQRTQETAYLFLRITLGVNFFLHGVARLIGDHAVFQAHLQKQMENAPLPSAFVHLVGVILPWCEGTVGFFIILGLLTPIALGAASLLMLALQTGVCLAQNWEVAGAQLIYVLLLFLLLSYMSRNRWSVDAYIRSRRI